MTRPPKFRIPFDKIKNHILGGGYELSLVLTDKRRSRYLNRTYRGTNKPTNVLSFPLSPDSGEIFIDLETAEKEAPIFGKSFSNFVAYLFIHGLLHLSGEKHGGKMDNEEIKILKKFKLNGRTNISRHRHRDI